MLANAWSAWVCWYLSAAKAAAGAGFCSTWITSFVAKMAASDDEVWGMVHVWGKNYGVGVACGGGGGDIDVVTSIMLGSMADVPTVLAMLGVPGAVMVCFFMDDNSCTKWGKGCTIKNCWFW